MAMSIQWVNEERSIILIEFKERWTWDEFHRADEQGRSMIRSVPHDVNMIVDFTYSEDLPSGALTELRTMLKKLERRNGKIIIVGGNMLIENTFWMFHKLYGKQAGFPETRFVKTQDEALAHLVQH